MRIGVDATCWANPRGYGRFTREIVPAMVRLAPEHTFVCLLDARAAAAFDLRLPNVERQVVAQAQSPTLAAAAGGSRSPADMLRLARATSRARLDVFFSPTVYTYFPLPPGLPAVVTVHDAIADRFPDLTLPGWRARAFWRAKVSLALWQARIVLTVSDFAAGDIARVLGVDPGRIRVALEAPAPAYRVPSSRDEIARAAADAGLPAGAPWFIYVGGFNPHKNLDVLARAHAALVKRTRGPAPHLVLVGPADDVFHSDRQRIQAAIDREGTGALVHWRGFLPDDQLRLLHAGAVALVLPSVCEGFGLPAVEAAACGTPVIATTESPLPQLLEGGGLFVPPGDTAALTSALETLAGDDALRARLGVRARERAGELSWERGGRAALDALVEAA
ncbi:MAG TPA: glycosyltransferase family 1 protein [Vicinamibacterales bacterium]|nr:glycosyltransferase family 1 protein [Vicinamibacterales bacterium]